MTIRELISKNDPKNSEFLDRANELLNNFNKTIKNNAISPDVCFKIYREELSKQHEAYFKTFIQKVYIQQYKKRNLITEVMKRGKDRITFCDSLFNECALFEISLLLSNYPENISEGQVKLGLFKMVLDNAILYRYDMYEKRCIADDFFFGLVDKIEKVLDISVDELTPINQKGVIDSIKVVAVPKIETKAMKKPTKAKHMLDLWTDGMTLIERVRAVQDYYGCSDSQARRYMKAHLVYDLDHYVDYEKLYEEAMEEIDALKKKVNELNEIIKKKDDFINSMF